jgi:hypothetical protein
MLAFGKKVGVSFSLGGILVVAEKKDKKIQNIYKLANIVCKL